MEALKRANDIRVKRAQLKKDLKSGTVSIEQILRDVAVAQPAWRGSAVGVYRLWRDLGFAVGAIVAGVIADAAGIAAAIWVVALITAGSGIIVLIRMRETRPGP